MTDFVKRALMFIRDHPNSYAWQVGQHLWPGHPMHRKPAGDCRGGNAGAVVAGGHMGKLYHRGLIRGFSGAYQITEAGLAALRKEPSE